jgi:hypothetical protein
MPTSRDSPACGGPIRFAPAEAITSLDGVTKTHTMVAFQAYSCYDLEALFSIGQ